jgi:hypothetical protein
MNSWRFTAAIDPQTDEGFARAVGFILPQFDEIFHDREILPDACDLLVQADFWIQLHHAG